MMKKKIIYQIYINILLGQCFVENNIELYFLDISNMQNIPNRVFMTCTNGSQADVLPWKPCTRENLDN